MYKTQMQAARQGILTEQMKAVAKKEHMDETVLMQRIAEGSIIIPANKNHKNLIPDGVGAVSYTHLDVYKRQDLSRFYDLIDEIFKTLIQNGKALEINTPELETSRLILRKFTEDDIDALLAIYSCLLYTSRCV